MMIQQKIDRLEKHLERRQAQLQSVYDRRLISGLLTFTALGAAAFFPENLPLNAVGFVIGPAAFIFFVLYSHRVRRLKTALEELLMFYRRQETRRQGEALEVTDELPPLPGSAHATDLDLFQKRGLFHFLDETFTPGGRNRLIDELLQPHRSAEEILQRQTEVKKLATHHWFLTRLLIDGRLSRQFKGHSEQLLNFVERPFLEKGFQRDYLILKALFALSLFGLANGIWGPWIPGLPPFLFMGIHFVYSLVASGNLKGVFERSHNMALQLSSLMPVMKRLEKRTSDADFTDHLKGVAGFSPGRRMQRLNWIISCLSVQGHPLVFIAVNGLCPWSFFFAKRLEKERVAMQDHLPKALEDLYSFEVIASLALLYKYQTQTMPEVSQEPTLHFSQAFHPLISREDVVANSFQLKNGTHLNLITGSNMSGKSSFLRTIGVNHLLFLLGAPVFAKSYKTYPFQLATCIRVTDALEDGISYFYAEVLRLKEIIEKTNDGAQPVLYLIDEIFRGTNNRERLIGSRSVLENLAESKSIGFVTTHDLELTQLADTFPLVTNWHFKDDVKDGEMTFNYLLQEGPCPTTNALKIMKSAGLPVAQQI